MPHFRALWPHRDNGINTEYNGISTGYNGISTEYKDITTEYNELITEYNNITTQYNDITTQYNKNKYHKTVLAFHRKTLCFHLALEIRCINMNLCNGHFSCRIVNEQHNFKVASKLILRYKVPFYYWGAYKSTTFARRRR